MATLPVFTPPSPGAWELEQTHMTRPMSVYTAEVFPEAMMRGFKDGSRAFGCLLDHLEVAVINRFPYTAPRPVGAPKGAKGPPPRMLFKLLQHVHPEMRRRIRRADDVFRDRFWRQEMTTWRNEVKPSIAAEAKALLAEDLSQRSLSEFVPHIRRVTAFAKETIYWHHRFSIASMVPVGDFVVHIMDWTGKTPSEILQVVRGLSPVSAGAVEELAAIKEAFKTDPEGMAILTSNRPAGDILTGLAARPTAVGPAVRGYVDVVGLRILGGYDVGEEHAREHPDLLLKAIRAAVTSNDTARREAASLAIARLRGQVPESHRAEFDALLEETQATFGLRDERVFHADALGIGIARRAILAAGERLQAAKRVLDPTHLVNASSAEIIGLLEGGTSPSAEELAERTRWRLETPLSSAPLQLGFPPSAPPPADWLPGSAARLQRIVTLVLSLMFDTHGPRDEGKALKGFGVSPGIYEGPARVIRGLDELGSVLQGEVLIATSTGPTFNIVLPLIGAVVTERGGALSHAAIVAREYGLPGVVGCPGATSAITTGTRVRVNGDTGEVVVLA